VLDRHPEAALELWGVKTLVDVILLGLTRVGLGIPAVGVLIVVLAAVYAIKLIASLAVPSWRAPGRIAALLMGLIILVAPVALGRAGVCAYDFRRTSDDEIISRAITRDIKNGALDPAIANMDDYFLQHDRSTCCRVASPASGAPGLSDLLAEFAFGRTVDVVYAGDTAQQRTRVEMCSRSVWWWMRSK
jgi:hypothetical protein